MTVHVYVNPSKSPANVVTAPRSKLAEPTTPRSVVVARAPPRRHSMGAVPKLQQNPEDIGHFVGTIGDSLDRGGEFPRGRCVSRISEALSVEAIVL